MNAIEMRPRFFFNSSTKLVYWLVILIGISLTTSFYSYVIFHSGRLLPNTTIDSTPVGSLTPQEAISKIKLTDQKFEDHQVYLAYKDNSVSTESATLSPYRTTQEVVREAFGAQHPTDTVSKLKISLESLFRPQTYHTTVRYNEKLLATFIRNFGSQFESQGIAPYATLSRSSNPQSLTIFKGSYGTEVLLPETLEEIQGKILEASPTATLKTASTSAELNEEQIENAYQRAEKFVGSSLSVSADDVTQIARDTDIIPLLSFPDGFSDAKIYEYIESWRDRINRPVQEPEFSFNKDTLVVEKFQPPRNGRSLATHTSAQSLTSTLTDLEASFSQEDSSENTNNTKPDDSNKKDIQTVILSVQTTEPTRSLSETNSLGIKERIGIGTSEYDHSIPNRIHNVALTTSKINNTIVPPGKEFSFNKRLGEVSSKTGFRSAYVIKNGQTELGDGGGVCQVSTTLFRSVLDAGLNVTRRLPHSYRVSYYELDQKPGIDATVYAGETDFRFINDTDNHILIHGEANSETLEMYIEIYGTSDGRTTEIIDHKTYGYKPPLPPEYFPDPSLPTGKLKQIDWSAAGITAEFTHVIKDANGNITNTKTYKSAYRPWSAKFLQGI